MNKKDALKVEKLTKIYSRKTSKEVRALNNLNLEVKEGEIFGLLGPNGAGKTTFLNILAGTVIKNSGSVNVWGYDLDKNPRQVRSSIGIVPQEVNLDAFFSPKDLVNQLLQCLVAMFLLMELTIDQQKQNFFQKEEILKNLLILFLIQ